MTLSRLHVFASLLFAAGAYLAAEPCAAAQEAIPDQPGRREAEAKANRAMESFDLLEFEAAKHQLGEALALVKRHRLERDPIAARVYLDLGIVEFAGFKNRGAAHQAFTAAVTIDPRIEIGVAYRTDAMAELLIAVKRARGIPVSEGGSDEMGGAPACAAVAGMAHTAVELARPGQGQPIAARVGEAVRAERVNLYYRPSGGARYMRVTMPRVAGCVYEAAIPAEAMQGSAIDYFVAAIRAGKIVAKSGAADAPHVIELAERGSGGASSVGASSRGPAGAEAAGGGRKTIFAAFALGTGGGWVTGSTEVVGSDVECCFARAPFHLLPEVGYYITRRLSVSAAFRMGFAIGADVPGHASVAPAGLVRLRYALSQGGNGLMLSALAGGGMIRHVVDVERTMGDGDTDTTASGPFILGGGVGYIHPVSPMLRLVAELNVVTAFPAGIDEIGSCPGSGCVRPDFSVGADLNLGVLVAF